MHNTIYRNPTIPKIASNLRKFLTKQIQNYSKNPFNPKRPIVAVVGRALRPARALYARQSSPTTFVQTDKHTFVQLKKASYVCEWDPTSRRPMGDRSRRRRPSLTRRRVRAVYECNCDWCAVFPPIRLHSYCRLRMVLRRRFWFVCVWGCAGGGAEELSLRIRPSF